MGRKGVSKRKPKKSGLIDNNKHGSPQPRSGGSLSPVQALVNATDAPAARGGTNSSSGSNKKNRKGR